MVAAANISKDQRQRLACASATATALAGWQFFGQSPTDAADVDETGKIPLDRLPTSRLTFGCALEGANKSAKGLSPPPK